MKNPDENLTQGKNMDLAIATEDLYAEEGSLEKGVSGDERQMREREEGLVRGKEEILRENEGLTRRNEVLEGSLLKGLEVIGSVKKVMLKVNDDGCSDHGCEEVKDGVSSFEGEMEEGKNVNAFLEGLEFVSRMTKRVEENEELLKKTEAYKERNKEVEEMLLIGFEVLGSTQEYLMRVCDVLDEKSVDHDSENLKEGLTCEKISEEPKAFPMQLDLLLRIAKRVEMKVNDYQEKVNKEKREMEISVLSLKEENHDLNTFLRAAINEKEEVERSLTELRSNTEQKRASLLQIADWGLQKVTFGFMKGGDNNEQPEQQRNDYEQHLEKIDSNSSTSSAHSQYEEEFLGLASTVEKTMKNLRLEITQLRIALDERRSEIERFQNVIETQTQQITEQTMCIGKLEDRVITLSENVDELLIELKAAEEDVERWREACELEVKAGKRAVEERDELVAILQQELEKARAELKVSNNKIMLKEELAAAAMAAMSAAERSLQLADTRTVMLHKRVEELSRQLEEADRRAKSKRRICWPWQALGFRGIDIRRGTPFMQPLLH